MVKLLMRRRHVASRQIPGVSLSAFIVIIGED